MNKILLFVTVLFVTSMAKADGIVLKVLLSDDQVLSINLNEEPRTTYQDGNLVITTTQNSITYPLEIVKRFTYVSASSGIDTLEQLNVTFSKDGELLTFTGLKPYTIVSLYNVTGLLLRTIDTIDNQKVVISASQFPPGIYVIKINDGTCGTYTILKR